MIQDPLEMWISLHRFNLQPQKSLKRGQLYSLLISGLLFITFFCSPSSFAESKLLERLGPKLTTYDRSLFRLGDQTYFYSDVKGVIESYKVFLCTMSDAQIKKVFPLEEMSELLKNLPEERTQALNQTFDLLRLNELAKRRKVVLGSQALLALKNAREEKSCATNASLSSKMRSLQKDFLRSEIFLRSYSLQKNQKTEFSELVKDLEDVVSSQWLL